MKHSEAGSGDTEALGEVSGLSVRPSVTWIDISVCSNEILNFALTRVRLNWTVKDLSN